ncbi:MAG: phytoene/squalene synthase family protein [Bdellovibrionales bacterium]
MSDQDSYCLLTVREHDPDRYLLAHFAPFKYREELFALFAFNYEIAKTRETVSETQLGLIRLQWWRDAIAACYDGGDVPEHPVMNALVPVIQQYQLPREPFDSLIYAREFDLEDVLPSHLEGVAHYADFTSTPLLRLSCLVVGINPDIEPIAVIGTNYALAGLLRASVAFAKQRRCYLPQDLMRKHNVSINQLYELKFQDNLSQVIEECSDLFGDGVRADHRFLRAHQRLATLYMHQLKKLNYDVFNSRLLLPPAFKVLRIYLDL